MTRVLKTLLCAGALAFLLVLAPAPATSATACWKTLVNDWYDNGRIDATYPIPCYGEALRHLPQDVEDYSSLSDDINRALQDAIHHRSSGGPGGAGPSGAGPSGPGTSGPTAGGPSGGGGEPSEGFFRRALDKLGPSNADSIPIPLLVLAGIAFLLLAAGTAGFLARRIQARRVPARPASVPPAPERGPQP